MLNILSFLGFDPGSCCCRYVLARSIVVWIGVLFSYYLALTCSCCFLSWNLSGVLAFKESWFGLLLFECCCNTLTQCVIVGLLCVVSVVITLSLDSNSFMLLHVLRHGQIVIPWSHVVVSYSFGVVSGSWFLVNFAHSLPVKC